MLALVRAQAPEIGVVGLYREIQDCAICKVLAKGVHGFLVYDLIKRDLVPALRALASTSEQPMRLYVRRDRGGQGELKSCAPAGGAGGPQAAAMRLNDRPTNGQPHTSPVILGRKECLEDLVPLLRGQSHAGIADRDQQLTVVGFRLDGKLTSATRFLHGIDAVEHEVHENLL